MIEITVFHKDDHYVGVESKGHAEYAEAGTDIVCAAVSVLMVNTLNSIEAFTDEGFDGEQKDGYLEFHLEETVGDAADLLMKSMVMGLKDIQKNYGETFIKIVTKEV